MQKVAWPTTIVHSDRLRPLKAKKALSAMPVMIPGSAIGRTTTNETTSRPKKRKRCTANAAADPRKIAIEVETSPALTDSQSASRISLLCHATPNHFVDSPAGGQLWMLDEL